MYSLEDLNVTKSCEAPFEFEVIDETTGKGIGLFLSVLGAHAERVQNLVTKAANERRTADAMAEKRDPRNKTVKVHSVEEDIAFSTELVAVRIVAWRGIKEEYSPENAIKLCTINPTIKEQILAMSENLKNFPTRFTPASNSTLDKAPG